MFENSLNRIWRSIIICLLFNLSIAQASALTVPVAVSPDASSIGVFIAKDRGYFSEHGLDVTINSVKFTDSQIVPNLASGRLLAAGINIKAEIYNTITQDIPVKIVADKGRLSKGRGYFALLVRKDHIGSGRFKSLNDLKGMKLAVTEKGVTQEIIIQRLLEQGALGLSDVRLVNLSYADMNTALANKSIDATIQVEPYVAAAVKKGIAERVAGADDAYPDQQSGVLMLSPEFIRKYPQQAQAFVTAYLKGLRDYNRAVAGGASNASLTAILEKYTDVKEKKFYSKMKAVGFDNDGMVNIDSLRDDAQWFFNQSYIRGLPNFDKLIDLRYIEKAKKTLDGN